jgi:hypothetical protein
MALFDVFFRRVRAALRFAILRGDKIQDFAARIRFLVRQNRLFGYDSLSAGSSLGMSWQ